MTLDRLPSRDKAAAEIARFKDLQIRLGEQFRQIFADDTLPRTVLIVPSLSLDREGLEKIKGVVHYEERMLCLLLLLRMPRTRVIYVTSEPIPEAIVDYYLHLLPGIPRDHARRRLTMLSCYDSGLSPLAAKILARPRLMARIREALVDPEASHMSCFNVTALERTMAVQLGIPIYGCDPDLQPLGSKSGSRAVFREAGLDLADGHEDLADAGEISEALESLKGRNPAIERAVVKLNEGFSGEGNAIFDFRAAPDNARKPWIRDHLSTMAFAAPDMTWEGFEAKFKEMGGIAEVFIDGAEKHSPSVQFRVDPGGTLETISTHDQVTGGEAGQIFLGCRFPADAVYRLDVQNAGLRAAEVLRGKGALGRFGIDFISVQEQGRWRHYAVEINLRKGGTTHPFQMLQFLTDGQYDTETGLYHARGGRPCYYRASDNIEAPVYSGLTPEDLVDIAVENGLHFHHADQTGVVFHLIGALSEHGKFGMLCVADSDHAAADLYDRTIEILDREGVRAPGYEPL